jgi:hypothetical protein
MVFEATDPVVAGTTVASVSCVSSVYVADPGYPILTADGSTTVTVEFSPALPDQDCCTVTFTGDIEDEWSIRVLHGDVDRDGEVLPPDASRVKSRMPADVNDTNFWYDVDCSDQILGSDVSRVKQRFGNAAPSCP